VHKNNLEFKNNPFGGIIKIIVYNIILLLNKFYL